MKPAPYMDDAQLDPIDRWCKRFVLVVLPLLLLFLITGCASMPDMTLTEHEEKHCEGYAHHRVKPGEYVIRYEWTKVAPASEKPWEYRYVADVHRACESVGLRASHTHRISGCAVWKSKGCVIILPEWERK